MSRGRGGGGKETEGEWSGENERLQGENRPFLDTDKECVLIKD